jgi:hypothetical protein
MKKYIRDVFGIFFIAFLFFLAMFNGEYSYLYGNITLPAGITLQDWLDNFVSFASWGLGISLTSSLLWYILGQWIFKINNWGESSKFWYWCLLSVPSMIASVIFCINIYQPQQGVLITYLFFIGNNLLCYYFATALFSPASYKYTPIWAKNLRRLW